VAQLPGQPVGQAPRQRAGECQRHQHQQRGARQRVALERGDLVARHADFGMPEHAVARAPLAATSRSSRASAAGSRISLRFAGNVRRPRLRAQGTAGADDQRPWASVTRAYESWLWSASVSSSATSRAVSPLISAYGTASARWRAAVAAREVQRFRRCRGPAW
jgi:hypothetical protein